jgi:cytochrome c biogenesis protein CcdA
VRIFGFLLFIAGLMLSFSMPGAFGDAISTILEASPSAIIPYISTLGTVLIWLGAALFVLGLRRRNRVDPAARPAPSKWGRGN